MVSFLMFELALTSFADHMGVDFLLVQDLSSSFEDKLDSIIAEIPDLMKNMAELHHGSRFGLASFIDKPVGDFGYEEDYCYRLHLELSYVEVNSEGMGTVMSGNRQLKLAEQLSNLTCGSGKDWKENQLGALLHAIMSAESGWDISNGNAKVLALATDAGYHVNGEEPAGLNLVRTNNSAMKYSMPVSDWCTTEQYPTLNDVAHVLRTNDVNLIIITTHEMKNYYERLIKALGVSRGLVVTDQDGVSVIADAVEAGFAALEEKGSFGVSANSRYSALVAKEDNAIHNEFVVMSLTEHHEHGAQEPAEFHGPKFGRGATDTESHVGPGGRSGRSHQAPTALELCDADTVFEVVWIQDASGGWQMEKENLYDVMPLIIDTVMNRFPGSRFAFESFTDKPVEPHGYEASGDYCAHMRIGLTEDKDVLYTSLKELVIRSGADQPEAQLHAMIHPRLTEKTQWTRLPTKNGKRVVRVNALVTDSTYHRKGDSVMHAYSPVGSWYDCRGMDYPAVSDVAEALIYDMVFPLFLSTSEVAEDYEQLLVRELKLNGAVQSIGNNAEKTKTLYDGFIRGLARICTFDTLTTPEALSDMKTGHSSPALTLHFEQKPKYLNVIHK